jgi:NAD(P)-dependent dehydrogenase (short-subunit alcohol dehydrogenase family)
MRLSGKRIVITGGSKGLGRALAQRFAREGAKLALCARHSDPLEVAAKELQEIGTEVVWRQCDIGNSVQVQEFVSAVIDKFESVDVLVNNASAISPLKNIADYSAQEWEEVVRTNINGLFNCTRGFIPMMIKQKAGVIINVSSSAGRVMRGQWGAYAISKYALEGFTLLLAEELRRYNISVNSVNPGAMATDMRQVVHPEEDQKLLRKPELVTELFVYLASNDGEGISGQQFDASTYVAHPKDKS